MLTQVDAKTQRGDITVGKFIGPPTSDPIHIRKIDGLGPVKAEFASTPYAANDGVLLSGALRGSRNIVFSLGLHPDWVTQKMSELRREVYKYFRPKAYVKLVFTSDHLEEVTIDCYVESCEPDMFSKDPEMVVSLIAPNPDFVATNEILLEGYFSAFHRTVNYAGDVPCGFEMQIAPLTYYGLFAVGSNWVVPDGMPTITQGLTFNRTVTTPGNRIYLNTIFGSRVVEARNVGGDVLDNMLKTMYPDSIWMQLLPGENDCLFSTVGAEVAPAYSITYHNRYDGL